MELVPSNNLNSEGKMLESKKIVEENKVLLHAECKPSRDESWAEDSPTLPTAQDMTSDEHDIDAMCKKLECPFTWRADVEVKSKEQGQVFDNFIDILTRKESEFSQAEHNLFREVVVHLVLSYHKSANRQLKSGAKDLYHCFKIICSKQEMCEKSNIFCSNEPELPQQQSDATPSGSFVKECSELMSADLKNCKLDKIRNINNDNISSQKDLDSKFSERSVANTVNSQHHEETTSFGNLFKINNFCEWKNNGNIFDSFFNDCKLNLCSNADNDLKFGIPKQKSSSDCKSQWNGNESKDRLFALQYVVAASLVYYCRMFGFIDDALKIAKAVINLFEEMNPVSKATIFALRGAILCEYGCVGDALGLHWLREAQSLDPDYWEWNLYCGKVVGRVRRNESEPTSHPSEEEIHFLKKTIELNPNSATALVNLANIHRAIASIEFRNSVASQSNSACVKPSVTSRLQGKWRRNSHGFYRVQREPWRCQYVYVKSDNSNSHLSMAKELYLKALQIEPNCPYNNARCAKGLLSMPFPFKDHATAQKAILHALTLAQDNSLVNHYAGMFYERCRDYEKALRCYEAAIESGRHNYPAELSYINLRLKISSPANYSPLFKFGILFYKYNMPNNKIQTLCSRGYYLYKIEGALIPAIRNFTAAIEVSPESSLLLRFNPGSFFMPYLETVNAYDILEEVLDQLKRNSDSGAKLIIERAEEALKHRNK